jgi:hypothetical protein
MSTRHGPWTSARPVKVVLGFCLLKAKGPKGLGHSTKVLGFFVWACLEGY